jgi:hypothetical protein
MADDNAEARDLNLPNLPVEVVVQANEPPHAGMELVEGEESTVEDPRQDSDDEFSAVVDGSDRDDDDLSQRSNLPTRTTFNRDEKVENISPTYCAAKELKLSVALMKHINDDAALFRWRWSKRVATSSYWRTCVSKTTCLQKPYTTTSQFYVKL